MVQWYFVTKIVPTYCEKKNVLVIEKTAVRVRGTKDLEPLGQVLVTIFLYFNPDFNLKKQTNIFYKKCLQYMVSIQKIIFGKNYV